MMSRDPDLLDVSSHFAFGKNWASYSGLIGDERIERAKREIQRLCGDQLFDARWLDIGCGSGLHSLAALELGVREATAVDLDENSVATTRALLANRAGGKSWHVERCSVFELESRFGSDFDVVYSWGVLHHTGDLNRALRAAARLVRPGGLFCFALYRRTMLCPLWRIEKRWYSRASERRQRVAQAVFRAVLKAKLRLSGGSFDRYIHDYHHANRGMDFQHDLHDWLGGYPYESISPAAVHGLMSTLGLELEREFVQMGSPVGLLGSGCDEYTYRRIQTAAGAA